MNMIVFRDLALLYDNCGSSRIIYYGDFLVEYEILYYTLNYIIV